MGFLQNVGNWISTNIIKPVGGYIERSIIKPIREKGFKGVIEAVGNVAGDVGNIAGTVGDIASAVALVPIPGLQQLAGTIAAGARGVQGISAGVGGLSRAIAPKEDALD